MLHEVFRLCLLSGKKQLFPSFKYLIFGGKEAILFTIPLGKGKWINSFGLWLFLLPHLSPICLQTFLKRCNY